MELSYDPSLVAAIYDEYGDQEWNRHETRPFHRVSFHIHRLYLNEFVHAGDLVLEAGAGAGRFTVELARLGARIVATDISPGQLELNAIHLDQAGLEQQIEARGAADIVDLSSYPDRSFDAVVCYGGPLSYVMDRADDALDELLRVTKLGGHLLLGVMSKHGSLQAFLGSAAVEIEEFGIEEMEAILETGDLPPNHSSMGMPVHLFSWGTCANIWTDIRAIWSPRRRRTSSRSGTTKSANGGCRIRAIWDRFLAWEVTTCAQPGAIDGGTHIIAVISAR